MANNDDDQLIAEATALESQVHALTEKLLTILNDEVLRPLQRKQKSGTLAEHDIADHTYIGMIAAARTLAIVAFGSIPKEQFDKIPILLETLKEQLEQNCQSILKARHEGISLGIFDEDDKGSPTSLWSD